MVGVVVVVSNVVGSGVAGISKEGRGTGSVGVDGIWEGTPVGSIVVGTPDGSSVVAAGVGSKVGIKVGTKVVPWGGTTPTLMLEEKPASTEPLNFSVNIS